MRHETPLHLVPSVLESQHQGRKCERELVTKWLHRLLRSANWDPSSTDTDYRVHEELTGPEGRVDLALKIEKRVVACIEVKDPSVDLEYIHLLQAVKYASSYYYPLSGTLNPIMAICTNGKVAYLMDPAVVDPTNVNNLTMFNLETADGLNELANVLERTNLDRADGSLPHISTVRKTDVREYASNTHVKFKEFVFEITSNLIDHGFSKKQSVELTILVLLLAAARDHGIIPNATIQRHSESGDWNALARHLGRLFGDVYSISDREQKVVWTSYDETRFLNLRLDVVPVHFMGIIYQELLTEFCGNKTSFYTPEEMIETVINTLSPEITDSILDPTCGSGAFLVAAIEKAMSSQVVSEEAMLSFFDRVVGVDKDPVAVKIAKVSLLCQFMRFVGEEFRRSGKTLPKPKIQAPVDFFDWEGGRFSMILGNPPWESIDKLNKKRKKSLRSFDCYQDKNDQLCYIIEKAIKTNLAPEGRFGFVIKQQSLLGDKYKKFCEFLDEKVFQVFDYGTQSKFGNYAQSAIIMGRDLAEDWSYTYLEPLPVAKASDETQTTRFVEQFEVTRGAQTGGANEVYVKYAKAFPTKPGVINYPKTLQLGGEPKKQLPIYFVSGEPSAHFKKWLLRNPKFRKKLTERGDVKSSISEENPNGRLPFSWRRNSVATKLHQHILVTERNLTPGKTRFPFYLTDQTSSLPLDGQTVIGSRRNSRNELVILASLMISRFFVPLCRECQLIPRRAGGIFLNPKTMRARLWIPNISKSDHVALIALMTRARRTPANEDLLNDIDEIWSSYFTMDVQSNFAGNYQESRLSSALHPSHEAEQLELEIVEGSDAEQA